jgi:hypothetical protein
LTARQIRELEIKEMVESFDEEQTYEKYQYGDSNPFDSSHSTGRLWNSSPGGNAQEEYERKSREWQANGGDQRF